MSRKSAARVLALVAAALCMAGEPADAACQLGKLGEFPVTMIGLRPTVPAKINGTEVRFLLDSGAFYSMLSPDSAAQLNLRLGPAPRALRLEGIGGLVEAKVATVNTLTLLGSRLSNVEFIVGGGDPGSGVVGVLGENLLRIADVEYDLAHGAIRLIQPHDCRNSVLAYWAQSQPISMMDIEWATSMRPHTIGAAYLNGARIRVIFDTGAAKSFVSLRAAKRAGFNPESPQAHPAGFSLGVGRESIKTYIAPFASFKIGDEEIRNAELRVGDFDLSAGDMLIGADFFLSHRIYVASSQHRLYFTYNGGPVFNLSRSSSPAGQTPESNPTQGSGEAEGKTAAKSPADSTGSADSAGSAASPDSLDAVAPADPAADTNSKVPGDSKVTADAKAEADAPTDAAAFSRRGAAFAARRDFEHAIADFTRAIELQPAASQYLRQRALARAQSGQRELAMADADRALELDPNDLGSRILRARLRLANHDEIAAAEDLDAAQRLPSREANVRYDLGMLDVKAGRFPQAVAEFTDWIAAHRVDGRLARALNERCWARALWGRELDQAIADCNAALRLQPRTAQYLSSRGLAEFRSGQLDKAVADWDAALASEPANGWILYCRGVGRIRQGNRTAGEADIAAAASLAPQAAAVGKRYGVVPERP